MKKKKEHSDFQVTGTIVVDPHLTGGTLAAVIKRARLDRDLTLRQLEAKVGCSHVYLSQIENRKRQPTEEILKRIQKALAIGRILIPRDSGYFQETSLAELRHPELLAVGISVIHHKILGVVLSALRRDGWMAVVKTLSASEQKKGELAIIDVLGGDCEVEYQIAIRGKK